MDKESKVKLNVFCSGVCTVVDAVWSEMCKLFYQSIFITIWERFLRYYTSTKLHLSSMAGRNFRPYNYTIDRYYSRPPGMRGLMNYGVTCCVNALLQSFSATWELLVLLDKWKPTGIERVSRNVPLQLRSALQAMQSDQPSTAPHQDFLHCLDENRISINVQHDADEVFLSVLNFLQQQMDDKAQALDIQNLYKISLEMHLQCSECTSIQSGTSFLLSLPLHLREGYNLLGDCMVSFFEPQELKDNNKCYCERCGEKTRSTQGFRLLSLPPILCVHLKRFRSCSGYTKKLYCNVTFPETIDFVEVLKEESLSENFVKEDTAYTLYAVIVHCGFAMFGHYTAYVRHKSDHSWYYTNDRYVSKVGI